MLRVLWPSANVSLAQQHVLASLLGLERAATGIFYSSLNDTGSAVVAAEEAAKLSKSMQSAVGHSPADMHHPKVQVGTVDDSAAATGKKVHLPLFFTGRAQDEAERRAKKAAERDFRPVPRNSKGTDQVRPWTMLQGKHLFIAADGMLSSDIYADCGEHDEAAPAVADEGQVWATITETPLQAGQHSYEVVLRRRGTEVAVSLPVLEASIADAARRAKEAKDAAVKEGKDAAEDASAANTDKEEEEEEGKMPVRVKRAAARYAALDVAGCVQPAAGWLLWMQGADLNDPHTALKVALHTLP